VGVQDIQEDDAMDMQDISLVQNYCRCCLFHQYRYWLFRKTAPVMSHFSQMTMMDEKMLPILADSHHPQFQKIVGRMMTMALKLDVDRDDDEW
jgi:hypothetical protein